MLPSRLYAGKEALILQKKKLQYTRVLQEKTFRSSSVVRLVHLHPY